MVALVLPASAGMSRGGGVMSDMELSAPRVSGDEPQQFSLPVRTRACSPRQRG